MISIINKHPDKLTVIGSNGYLGHSRAIWLDCKNSFTLVGNPYERIVSAYFYFVKNKDAGEHLPFAGRIIERYPTFEKFVLSIEHDGLLLDYIPHIKPMHFWAATAKKVIVNTVFKIEEPETIDAFLSSLGISERFSDTWENISPHKPYMDYMTKPVIAEINKLYRRDFQLFNYKMI